MSRNCLDHSKNGHLGQEPSAKSSAPSVSDIKWEMVGPCKCKAETEGPPPFPWRMRELSQWFFGALRWLAR